MKELQKSSEVIVKPESVSPSESENEVNAEDFIIAFDYRAGDLWPQYGIEAELK